MYVWWFDLFYFRHIRNHAYINLLLIYCVILKLPVTENYIYLKIRKKFRVFRGNNSSDMGWFYKKHLCCAINIKYMLQSKEKHKRNCDIWSERLVVWKDQYIHFHGHSIQMFYYTCKFMILEYSNFLDIQKMKCNTIDG